jgi:glutathione S-transferase
LKVPYELEIFHRNKETKLADPELKKVHALGKSPVITVTQAGSTEPTVIAESGFIVEYLLDHFGSGSTLLPKRYREGQEGKVGGETEEWLRFKYFLHYAEGSLMSLMVLALVALSKPPRSCEKVLLLTFA